MGLIGWFLLMLIGVSSKLVPMFLVSSYQSTKLLTCSYYLIVGALLYFLVDSYLFGLSLRTYLIFTIGATGLICYFIFIVKCLRSRLRKHIDLPMMNSFLSFILLKIATLTVPFIVYFHLKNNPATIRFSMIYGEFMLMGWITALILGQTFKTLPFIVWVKHYEHLTGKFKTPMPADLLCFRCSCNWSGSLYPCFLHSEYLKRKTCNEKNDHDTVICRSFGRSAGKGLLSG
jgi:hypothetical protein